MFRSKAVALRATGVLVIVGALAACSGGVTTVEQAEAQVRVKQQAVDSAAEEFAAASAAFCTNAEDYVLAIDGYGDVLHDTAPTVGDVVSAGADLADPRDAALEGAEDAVEAQQELYAAEVALADAEEVLESLQATPSRIASQSAEPDEPEPLAPESTVERVKQADQDFADAQTAITPETPLSDAAELFHSAAVALELSWMRLFVDAGCATDQQVKNADEAMSGFVMAVQQDLADAGYDVGEVDGIYGPQTTQAVEDLQAANDLPVTGTLDQATIAALQGDLVEQGKEEAAQELATTAAIQQTLALLGFWDGPIDGQWTDALTDAVKEFQKALGVEETGEVDAETIAAFNEALEKLENPESSPTPTPSPAASPSPTEG